MGKNTKAFRTAVTEMKHFLFGAALALTLVAVVPVLAQTPPPPPDGGGTISQHPPPPQDGGTATMPPPPTGGTMPTSCPPGETGTPPNCSGATGVTQPTETQIQQPAGTQPTGGTFYCYSL